MGPMGCRVILLSGALLIIASAVMGRVAFEKLTELDYRGTTYYTIRNLSLWECQGWCREEPECASASFSFVMNPLAPVQETLCLLQNETLAALASSQPQRAVSLYYMVKLSIRSDKVCNRPWTFERVPNKMVKGLDNALIFTSSKESCLASCLNERRFTCRSAEYNYVTLQCHLSQHDRRSVDEKAEMIDVQGVDYFENLCLSTSESCQGEREYEEPQFGVPTDRVSHYVDMHYYVDKELMANSAAACTRACEIENEFLCRSFLYKGPPTDNQYNCQLFHLDHFTLPDGPSTFLSTDRPLLDNGERTGAYYENRCKKSIDDAGIPDNDSDGSPISGTNNPVVGIGGGSGPGSGTLLPDGVGIPSGLFPAGTNVITPVGASISGTQPGQQGGTIINGANGNGGISGGNGGGSGGNGANGNGGISGGNGGGSGGNGNSNGSGNINFGSGSSGGSSGGSSTNGGNDKGNGNIGNGMVTSRPDLSHGGSNTPNVNCDNTGVCYDVSVHCKDTRIVVEVGTTHPFNGRIYALGRSETCNVDVINSDKFRLDLSMVGQDCNTQSAGGVYTNTVVIQHHSIVMTKTDKIYKIRCTYDMSSRNITFGMLPIRDPDMIPITSAPEAPPPRIRILDGELREVETVRIGDQLTFRIEIPEETPYGIFARSCVAMAKDSRSTFQIIDDDGCPVEPAIFPQFTREGAALQSVYEAFRFTESYGVIFQCNVKYCLGPCEPAKCQIGHDQVDSWGRRKRRGVPSARGGRGHVQQTTKEEAMSETQVSADGDEMSISQEILVLDLGDEQSQQYRSEPKPSVQDNYYTNNTFGYEKHDVTLFETCPTRSSVLALAVTCAILLLIYVLTVFYFVMRKWLRPPPKSVR